jgi:transposase
MLQITPQMRILGALEPVDGRKGIDRFLQLCREKLMTDPFSGCLFLFRRRRATSIRVLAYDGPGFWLAQKRRSKGRFAWWPSGSQPARTLEAYQAQLLLVAGNPDTPAAPLCGEESMSHPPEASGGQKRLRGPVSFDTLCSRR